MNDKRFSFERLYAVKGLIEDDSGKVLLVKELDTNKWMPGKWGLPGGKPYERESLVDTFARKMKEELGRSFKPFGVYKIEELLLEGRTVLMFIFVAKANGELSDLKGTNYQWVGRKDLESMDVTLFTEYFNKELLLEYLSGNRNFIPMTFIRTWNFVELEGEPDFESWWKVAQKYVK